LYSYLNNKILNYLSHTFPPPSIETVEPHYPNLVTHH